MRSRQGRTALQSLDGELLLFSLRPRVRLTVAGPAPSRDGPSTCPPDPAARKSSHPLSRTRLRPSSQKQKKLRHAQLANSVTPGLTGHLKSPSLSRQSRSPSAPSPSPTSNAPSAPTATPTWSPSSAPSCHPPPSKPSSKTTVSVWPATGPPSSSSSTSKVAAGPARS